LKNQKFLKLFKISLAGLYLASSFSAFARNPIKSLTSNKKAKEVKSDLISSPSTSFSSGVNLHSFGLAIGQTFLGGSLADLGDDLITVDFLYDYSASHSFNLLLDFHYSDHNLDKKYVKLLSLTAGIKAKIYNYDNFSPFIIGGFGFYAPKVRRLQNNVLTTSKTKTVFGMHIGAGVDLRLNRKFKVGLLSELHNPFDIKQDNQEIVEGHYFNLLMTVFYSI